MLITSLYFKDKQSGLTLQKLSLDRFNLLVGASGVGKTQILRAIRTIQRFVLTDRLEKPVSFDIEFQHDGEDYTWQIDSAYNQESADNTPKGPTANTVYITRERITSSSGGVLIDREQDNFLFAGKKLPQLNLAESALTLINEEPIAGITYILLHYILDDHPYTGTARFDDEFESLLEEKLVDEQSKTLILLPPEIKAFLLKNKSPEKFDRLKEIFKSIFTSVEDISIEKLSSRGAHGDLRERKLQFKIKEHGIPHWVPAADISSGMLRTLIHLVDLTLAPIGSVVLIDEFENSLGVNCMAPLTDFILSRTAELQFLITSHHPYIINKIPKTHWKVVRRHGSTVKVTPAGEVRALQGSSFQDEFTRLINSPEFEEGIT